MMRIGSQLHMDADTVVEVPLCSLSSIIVLQRPSAQQPPTWHVRSSMLNVAVAAVLYLQLGNAPNAYVRNLLVLH